MGKRQGFRLELVNESHTELIDAFNERMAAGGDNRRLSVGRPFSSIAEHPDSPIRILRYAALIGDDIHGGVNIKLMRFEINGRDTEVAFYSFPLSEGIVNPKYGMVAILMQKEIVKRYPLVYGLGVGSLQEPVARLMKAGGWSSDPIPFFFKVFNANPFLKNLVVLRSTRWLRTAGDIAAATYLGELGLTTFSAAQRLAGKAIHIDGLVITPFTVWDAWADDLWMRVRGTYALIGDRSVSALSALYNIHNERLLKIKIENNQGDLLGWVVLIVARLENHNYFGNLTLGSMVDMLAEPQHALQVVSAALRTLQQKGADLAIVNHAHQAWINSFNDTGMTSYKTNFFLFMSPSMQQAVGGNASSQLDQFVFTRGDGDGPSNLY